MAGNQGKDLNRLYQVEIYIYTLIPHALEERVGFEPTELVLPRLYGFQDRSIHPLWQRSRCGYSEEAGNTVSTCIYHRENRLVAANLACSSL